MRAGNCNGDECFSLTLPWLTWYRIFCTSDRFPQTLYMPSASRPFCSIACIHCWTNLGTKFSSLEQRDCKSHPKTGSSKQEHRAKNLRKWLTWQVRKWYFSWIQLTKAGKHSEFIPLKMPFSRRLSRLGLPRRRLINLSRIFFFFSETIFSSPLFLGIAFELTWNFLVISEKPSNDTIIRVCNCFQQKKVINRQ